MALLQSIFIDISSYQVPSVLNIQSYLIADFSLSALITFFYPIGGLLADLKFSRYKTIVSSIWMLVVATPLGQDCLSQS